MILEDRIFFNQAKSVANHDNNATNASDEKFIQVINGIRLTLGYDPHNYFNLSILGKQRSYQTDILGCYDKSKPVLDPLEWIKSDAGNKHIANIRGNIEDEIFASGYQHENTHPATIYTRNYYLWLGYLKHCIGDIDTAIKAELCD